VSYSQIIPPPPRRRDRYGHFPDPPPGPPLRQIPDGPPVSVFWVALVIALALLAVWFALPASAQEWADPDYIFEHPAEPVDGCETWGVNTADGATVFGPQPTPAGQVGLERFTIDVSPLLDSGLRVDFQGRCFRFDRDGETQLWSGLAVPLSRYFRAPGTAPSAPPILSP
jgi:hypothetical protein